MLSDFYNAPYFSLSGAAGKQFSFANIHISAAFGAHVVDRQLHNGVFNVSTHLFSPLLRLGNSRFRQFLNADYATHLNKNNAFGNIYSKLPGNGNDDLKGMHRLMFNTESDFFTSVRIIGFRMVVFVFFEGEWLSDNSKPTIFEHFNWMSGVGIRLRNDLLAFNTIVLTVGFYPGARLGDFFGTTVSDLQRSPNFLPRFPEVVQVR